MSGTVRWSPPFACCPVTRQCLWKTLIEKKIWGNRSWLIHLILEAVIPYEDDTEDLKIQRTKHFLNHNIGSDKSCKCWKTCKSISPKNLFTIFWLATKRFTALTCPPRYFNDAWQNTNFNGSTYNVIMNNTEQKMKVFIKDFFSKCHCGFGYIYWRIFQSVVKVNECCGSIL